MDIATVIFQRQMDAHMVLTHNLQLLLYCLFCCKWDHKFKNEYHALLKKTLNWELTLKSIREMHCFNNKSCELQSTVGLFHLSEDLPPVRHMKECRSKTLDPLCLLFFSLCFTVLFVMIWPEEVTAGCT